MGSFLDYHNKRNKTSNTAIAPTNSNSTSSFLAYHKKREEERKKQEALRKAQEETKNSSNKMSDLKAEALRKQYGDKLSEFNDIKLPKAINNSEKDKIINNTPLKDSAHNKTKSQIEAEPVRLNSYKPREKEWYEKILQTPEAYKDNTDKAKELLKDGLQLKDMYEMSKEIGKDNALTIGGTAADAILGVGKGIIGIGENIGDGISAGIAQVADWTGNDEYADIVRNNIANKRGHVITDTISKGQKAVDNNSVIGDTGDMATEGIGQALGIWALGGAAGKIAGVSSKGLTATQQAARVANATNKARSVATFASAAGGTFSETYQNEDVEDWQAWAKAFGTGYISQKIEKIGGLFSVGGADKVATNALTKNMESSFWKSAIRNLGIGIAEGGEEAAEYVMGRVLDLGIDVANILTTNNDTRFLKEWDWDEFWNNIFVGTMSGTTLGAGQTTSSTVDAKISNPDITWKQAFNEAVKQQDIQAQIEVLDEKKASLEKELASKKLNDTDINEIFNEMQEIENTRKELVNSANNIENSQETLYNNNESESGINGENRQGNTNGIQERTMGSQEENAFSIDRYKQEETTIRQRGEVEYSENDKTFADKLKNKYNKKPFIYDDTNESYGGGLSYIDNDTIMFGRNALNDYGYDFLEGHEILEDINKNHKDVSENTINNLKEKLQEDDGFGDVFLKYLADMKDDVYQYYIDKPELIAKEIIGDLNGLRNANIDYRTLENYSSLNPELVQEIQNEILNLENTIYSKGNSNKSSFSMAENNIQNKKIAPLPVQQNTQQTENKKVIAPLPKTMNPTEISNLKLEDASTTPKLEQKNYKTGNKQSSFLSNIITDSKFLSEDLRQEMAKEDNIRYYQGITNEKTLENAYNKLQKDGQSEVIKWHSKDSKEATAEDVAEGWILLKQYQDSGDYQSAVEVAKKMRDIGTTAGQTVQAYNILSRLTPEGMFYYAQAELNEAYNIMVEGKSKKWIEENKSKFDLTPEETQNILDIMQDVSIMEDGYDKKVKLAEVQKIITDKIPPTKGQSIKAWMRISMLFNPKTQVRNIIGNAIIAPVNMFSDSVSTGIDKLIAKRTGVRTTGNTSLKSYGKGFKKGLYESYNDFRKGINTRNIEGNRFEISEGKNFKDKGIGKALNRVDRFLSFMLDAGDRGFYEATFTNSINNQMILNKTDIPTQEMIDIATNEALQRTWQDNNKYTQTVLNIRKILNLGKGYGLGDILIPFAKTPANLTKAIVDYSPVGLVKTLTTDARKLKNSLYNGQYTPQMQHKFVQNLGKATAGTFLYVLSYALVKAGIATGEADEDKDIKNFMKNSLGISSYSIKIGDKSFTYDWAQPIAAPLSIMTNIVNSEDKGKALLESVVGNIDTAGSVLLEQSFLQSINEVLNDNDGVFSGIMNQVLDLPARAVPTFSKQIADMVDGTQRTTFEYGEPLKSAGNSIIAKIPFASKSLPASVDTLGNEIQKYGGNNNVFNVMLNPANTNKGELSEAGEEIYKVYEQTGDTTIFPRTAPYYINNKGEKITMTAEERNEFQSISGKYVNGTLNKLLKDSDYKKLSDEEKANIINEIVSDSYAKAKYDVLDLDSKEYEKLRNTLKVVSTNSYYSYKFKTKDLKKDSEKIDILINANYTNKEKTALYENNILSSIDKKYPLIKSTGIDINEYLKYKNQEFTADKKDDGTVDGKSISGSKKQKVKSYIENMDITYTQKLVLYGLEYTPSDSDKTKIINYIKSIPNKTNKEKLEMLDQFGWVTIYKNGGFKY